MRVCACPNCKLAAMPLNSPIKSSNHHCLQWIIVTLVTILLVLLTILIIAATTISFTNSSNIIESSSSSSSSSSPPQLQESIQSTKKSSSSSSLPTITSTETISTLPKSSSQPASEYTDSTSTEFSSLITFVTPVKLTPAISSVHSNNNNWYPNRFKPPTTPPLLPNINLTVDIHHEQQQHNYDSGQFRPFYAPVWDPHPQYKFNAFGSEWVISLYPAAKPLIEPTVIHHEGNFTRRDELGVDTKCFYNGIIVGDESSMVTLSLCQGMTGHIRTKSGSYFIEPIQNNNNNNGSRLHKLYKVGIMNNNNGTRKASAEAPASAVSFHDDDFIHNKNNNNNNNPKKNSQNYGMPVVHDNNDNNDDNDHDSHGLSFSHDHGFGILHKFDHENEEEDLNSNGTLFITKRRVKRSESSVRYIELMVATDSTMSSYHGDNLTHYVYTLLSIVALIYSDASIGNPMNIALVKFYILKDPNTIIRRSRITNSNSNHHRLDLLGNKISASEMLSGFCKWQKEHNDENEHSPDHYDTALLLTRETICRNPQLNKCDTLGLAELGTMCDKYASCAIVQDNGLSAAFTIAHELGHLMNMPHDDDTKCIPFGGGARTTSAEFTSPSAAAMNPAHYVMSRMLDHNTYPWAWSRCSRHYLTEFLDVAGGHGKCLEDEPPLNLLPQNTKAPGEAFSKDEQCQLVFGPNSQLCSYMPVCRRLWCTSGGIEEGGCRTQHMPWADGTPCSPNGHKWCQRGSCVLKDLEQLKVVDGNWGQWKPFGPCSRPCSGGVRISTRECDNPQPSNGGKYCTGKRIQYESCNTHECPGEHKDFRAEQCSEFNNDNFNIQGLPRNVSWVPKYTGILPKDRCKLFCRVSGSSAYYLLREKVIDGTPCGPDTFDVCVHGNCVPAGCDRRLYSSKVLDSCGVCSGDSTTCRSISGSYNETKYGYSEVVRIPSGASNIDIRQRGINDSSRDDNYLAILDPTTNDFLLNGHFVVSMFRKTFHVFGTTLEYSGSDSTVERINSSSLPLKSDLIIQVLCVGKLQQPDIRYQYIISTTTTAGNTASVSMTPTYSHFDTDTAPPSNEKPLINYRWKLSDQLTECDRICGGKQTREYICMRVSSVGYQIQQVENAYCTGDPPSFSHQQQQQPINCNMDCVLKWSCSHSSDCSDMVCIKEVLSNERTIAVVGTENCGHLPKECEDCPLTNMISDDNDPPEWSTCSKICGEGISTCIKNCRKGEDSKRCNNGPCGQWRINEWSPCSTTCGSHGIHRALYSCHSSEGSLLPHDYCSGLPKPIVERRCDNPPCNLQWVVGEWSNCSTSCGNGKMRRPVQCVVENGIVNDKYCIGLLKPLEEADCQSSDNCDLKNYEIDNYIVPFDGISAMVDWIVEAWSECDEYDPEFKVFRRRLVHCKRPGGCSGDDPRKPIEFEECKNVWWLSEWGRCNTTCGDGIETRIVICPTGSNCPPSAKPPITRPCRNNSKCKYRRGFYDGWNVGPWGKCSKLCGGGMRLRQVVCATDGHCSSWNKPSERGNCNLEPCPIWHTSSWGSCSVECGGGGIQERNVVCRDHNGFIQPGDHCILTTKPNSTQVCGQKRCSADRKDIVRWRVGAWSNCTKACGKGTRRRLVQCTRIKPAMKGEDQTLVIVPDSECLIKKPKPKVERGCARFPCPFQWVSSEWSECSASCGYGIQQRNVSCHRVNKYGWIDPDAVPNGCESIHRPKEYHYCKAGGECNSAYRWITSEWMPCPVTKNCKKQPKQKRKVYCGLKMTGQRVGGRFCANTEKPERRRPCPKRNCKPSSCAEFQIEGETQLWVGGTNVSIYCAKSRHQGNEIEEKLVEYLTLTEDNYAEFFAKRLMRPDTCPQNGARIEDCECVEDDRRRVGLTTFEKIRLDVERLAVIVDDFTFTKQVSGSGIPFGQSGDCYSTMNCPQGRFSINLEGTGFQVSPVTTWVSQGRKAAMWINRSEDNVRVFGRCGGYCGSCEPDGLIGLKLQPA